MLKNIIFKFINQYDGLASNLNQINISFSKILMQKRPDLVKLTPYLINIHELIPKNAYTKSLYVGLDKADGTLDFYLSFKKLKKMLKFPYDDLLWGFFHEFRHKIQNNSELIKSVIHYDNWNNFKKYMQKITSKDEDFINHIFHELNPCEVDAHIFASEMSGHKFRGSAFDITPQSLQLLTKNPK